MAQYRMYVCVHTCTMYFIECQILAKGDNSKYGFNYMSRSPSGSRGLTVMEHSFHSLILSVAWLDKLETENDGNILYLNI